jgi:hypothetical protein
LLIDFFFYNFGIDYQRNYETKGHENDYQEYSLPNCRSVIILYRCLIILDEGIALFGLFYQTLTNHLEHIRSLKQSVKGLFINDSLRIKVDFVFIRIEIKFVQRISLHVLQI